MPYCPFLYAMLGHDCRFRRWRAHGLDPQVGFLHADRPGRAGPSPST